MKKVYIPTEEEIQQLQYLGMNTYSYILSKAVEVLIMEDVIYDKTNMLEIAYNHLSDFPEIVYAICRMYPEKIATSEFASRDISLCRRLTEKLPSQDKSIYYLDNLTYFDQQSDVTLDSTVVKNTSSILADRLTSTPRYRFDYREPNILLDNIFACDLSNVNVTKDTYDDLISIDPVYITKLGFDLASEKRKLCQNKSFALPRGMMKFTNRYGMDNINTTNQQEKTKKLIRCLEYHRQKY